MGRAEISRGTDDRLRLHGEIDLSNAQAVGEVLRGELSNGTRPTIDLSALSFMDSQGLRLFISLAREAVEGRRGPVVLLNPSSVVRRLFEIALPTGMPGLILAEEGA